MTQTLLFVISKLIHWSLVVIWRLECGASHEFLSKRTSGFCRLPFGEVLQKSKLSYEVEENSVLVSNP